MVVYRAVAAARPWKLRKKHVLSLYRVKNLAAREEKDPPCG